MEKNDSTPVVSVPTFSWQALKPHQAWLWCAVLVVVAASAISTLSSYIFKLIIDAIEAGEVERAFGLGLLYPGVVLIIQLLYRLSGYAVAKLTVSVSKTLTDRVYEYLFNHAHSFFADRFAGSITNKVRNITGAFEQIIPDIIWGQLDTLVTFLTTFVLIFTVSPLAAGAFLLLLSSLLLLNSLMAKQKAQLAKANAAAGTELQGRAVDVMGNMSAVRQFVRQRFELDNLALLTEKKRSAGLKNWLYTEKMLLLNAFIIFVFNFLMFWLLVGNWRDGVISSGEFVLVVALMSQITGTMLFVGRAVNATARAFGELREGIDDIYEAHGLTDDPQATPLTVTAGDIAWSRVAFRYEDNPVFTDFSLAIPGRQKLGLVGTSGAGKSTFVSLMLRQHELTGGAITIDGQDIRLVTQASLREAISVVPQEPVLFHRSIFDNIAYGKEGATQAEVIEVAKLAHAHDFIMSLKDGYDTTVGERGVKLSGGQKQRIAIARAMLKNAPILILDEATSALDSESEHHIQAALRTLMDGKTVIAIAHRLSTLKEMDRIIVLEGGMIVEDGSPDVLATGTGTYARLWSHQAGGFLTE